LFILWLSLFYYLLLQQTLKVRFFRFQIFFFTSYTIFYPILVTLFYYVFSLQEGIINVLEIRNVQKLCVGVLRYRSVCTRPYVNVVCQQYVCPHESVFSRIPRRIHKCFAKIFQEDFLVIVLEPHNLLFFIFYFSNLKKLMVIALYIKVMINKWISNQ